MARDRIEKMSEKPRLRGVIHLVMSPISVVAGLVLVTIASELRGRITATIFPSPQSPYLPVALSITA